MSDDQANAGKNYILASALPHYNEHWLHVLYKLQTFSYTMNDYNSSHWALSACQANSCKP